MTIDKSILINDLTKRQEGGIAACDHNLKGIRTGRASPNFLDSVVVEAYGDRMHISQLANLTISDARTISIQVWDKALVKQVEKSISNANLGVNPLSDGQTIRVVLPLLTQDRRLELAKIAHKFGEEGKVAIRNTRRDVMDQLKKLEKDQGFSKDQIHDIGDEIQKITDSYIKKIDELVLAKETDIKST